MFPSIDIYVRVNVTVINRYIIPLILSIPSMQDFSKKRCYTEQKPGRAPMQIQDLENPLPLKIRDSTGISIDITGYPAEQWVMTMVNTATDKERRGNGKFVILNPRMGLLSYKFSEDDLAQEGEYALWFGHDDDVAGIYERFEMVVENRW
jgi:hypothetical protein